LGLLDSILTKLLAQPGLFKEACMTIDLSEGFAWFKNVVTEHYIDFESRAGRAEFWYFTLIYFMFDLILYILESLLGFGSLFSALFALGLFLPSLSLAFRRLHDTRRSAWWLLIGLIPLLGWIVLIYWYVQPGTPGANRFGPEARIAPSGARSLI
jgi:uncharacterized membrane protein YhaH (DUF805 family)